MELYIRSQDKEALLKVNNGLMYWEDTNKRHTIVIKETSTNLSIMGIYKTKGRALEVLDEIQNLFIPTFIIQDKEIYNEAYGRAFAKYREKFKHSKLIFLEKGNVKIVNNDIVYEMPKK